MAKKRQLGGRNLAHLRHKLSVAKVGGEEDRGEKCQVAKSHRRRRPTQFGMIAVPLLSVLAGLIGQSRRLYLKSTYHEPSLLWTATIAPVGSAKSPSVGAAQLPMTPTRTVSIARSPYRCQSCVNRTGICAIVRFSNGQVPSAEWVGRLATLPLKEIFPISIDVEVSRDTGDGLHGKSEGIGAR
jgi:hypothetical protein